MKKTLAVFVLSALFMTGAFAQFSGPSRYERIQTVEQAHGARRGQDVRLDGFIVKHLRGTYYLFRDSTGDIRVSIGRLVWQGGRVTPKTPVRLTGRMDRDVRESYLRVERMKILK